MSKIYLLTKGCCNPPGWKEITHLLNKLQKLYIPMELHILKSTNLTDAIIIYKYLNDNGLKKIDEPYIYIPDIKLLKPLRFDDIDNLVNEIKG